MEIRPSFHAFQTASDWPCPATGAEPSVPTEALVAPAPGDLDDRRLKDLARRLPKVDLHRHLEAAGMEPEVVIRLAGKYGIELPSTDPETLRPYLQVTEKDKTLLDFLKKFDTIGRMFVNREIIEEIGYESVALAARDNVKYLELRFSPLYMAQGHGLDLDEVTRAVIAGVQRGSKEFDLPTSLIMIVERQRGVEDARTVERLAEKYRDQGVVGLDLANDEYNYPPGPYAGVFQDARQAGLHVTVHAGEAAGPENVRTSIQDLGAERIGHGVRTWQDAMVEQLVRQMGIPLELCPTSNVQTGAVGRMQDHPLKRYFDQGMRVTVNTDDPSISGITLSDEIATVVRQFGFSLQDLEKMVQNGVDAAFLPQDRRQELAREVAQGFDAAEEWLKRS